MQYQIDSTKSMSTTVSHPYHSSRISSFFFVRGSERTRLQAYPSYSSAKVKLPKRKNEDKLIQLYQEKIKRLEKQHTGRRRRIIVSSDSESDSQNEEIETQVNELMDTNILDETLADSLSPENQTPLEVTSEETTDAAVELDPEIRLALGDQVEEIPTYGANIHADIAKRWLPVLRKGLSKEVKEQLLKEHSVPDNCRLLKAPSLNPEISAAVADVVRFRDKKLETKQSQLGLGITAVSKAMSKLLENGQKVEVIKLLSEGCRILSDLHYTETKTRSKLITPCLDKAFLNIIQDEERDDTLFGNKLSEKIKSAKVIEKQGLQIKRNAPSTVTTKPTLTQQTPARRQAGNWPAPTRYPTSANRGGRGGYTASRPASNYRKYPAQAPPPPPAASAPLTRQAANRQRAPTRQ